jgi:5-methylthioribose kinase
LNPQLWCATKQNPAVIGAKRLFLQKMFFLNADDTTALTAYLKSQHWIGDAETIVSASKAGEGNMNYVLRVNTGSRTFIIKQSRGYVEKYPSIAAPAKRALSEAAFYTCIQENELLKATTPLLTGIDAVNNILAMQDLGAATDYTFLYNTEKKLDDGAVQSLVAFLNKLHGSIKKNDDPLLVNRAMKELNHQHIFIFPFLADNGFNLDGVTAGLQSIAGKYQNDALLKERARQLGEVYLATGNHLLHGDYYPGSWLHTPAGIKIIDPEFCFFGPAEFDLAVMMAHGHLSCQSRYTLDLINTCYRRNAGFDEQLLRQFTGIEILRRLLGLAQLPLALSLPQKEALLEKGYQLVMA